jgi:hypothetical protein
MIACDAVADGPLHYEPVVSRDGSTVSCGDWCVVDASVMGAWKMVDCRRWRSSNLNDLLSYVIENAHREGVNNALNDFLANDSAVAAVNPALMVISSHHQRLRPDSCFCLRVLCVFVSTTRRHSRATATSPSKST